MTQQEFHELLENKLAEARELANKEIKLLSNKDFMKLCLKDALPDALIFGGIVALFLGWKLWRS